MASSGVEQTVRMLISGWFSQRAVGSGIYTERLVAALRDTAAPDEQVELLHAPAHTGLVGKLAYEQVHFPLASRGFDVAHVPYWAPPLLPGAPTVVTVHDLIPMLVDEYRRHTRVRAYTRLVATATRRAAAVIADSAHTAADVIEHLEVDSDAIHVVPLGVHGAYHPATDPSETAADDKLRRSLGLPERFGLYLGGFDHRKNLTTLLRAWRDVYTSTSVPLAVAGSPPRAGHPWARHPAEDAAAAGLPAQALHLLGHVPTHDLPSLYRAAAVFAYPSRYEGFGLPPLEAMACGTPVVCSNATSLPEVVGDGGLLVDPTDVRAWAHAVTQVLCEEARAAQLGHAGVERAKRFTWHRTALLTLDVYRAVAGR